MRHRIFHSTLVLVLFASTAHAQVGDWQNVQSLPPGTPIIVQDRSNVRCSFQRATDQTLFCWHEFRRRSFRGPVQLVLERGRILQISLEADTPHHAAVGAVIGAGIGALAAGLATAANRSASNPEGSAFIGGLLGGTIGWLVGKHAGPAQGEVIYRR
jgi:hypothetical protein